MPITEAQVDTLTHNLANSLSAYGTPLDSDLMSDLNDLLSGFLSNKCDVEIIEADDEESTVQVAFDISFGTVCQQARIINKAYDEEAILEGLASGKLATTTWH